MKISPEQTETIVYQSRTGALELKSDLEHHTIWLTQKQITDLFSVQKAAISKHIKNIFDSGELKHQATVSKMETVQKEGNRTIKRTIEYYNLDLVLSIGYRVNSIKATHFRQWATKTLKEHMLQGYTFNSHRIKNNSAKFLQAIEQVKNILSQQKVEDPNALSDLVTYFSDTWLLLDAYDREQLLAHGLTKKKSVLTAQKLNKALHQFRQSLIASNQASELFCLEKDKNSIEGIVGNVMQSFSGQDVYRTIEEKAAHLLYFIVKNHPFIDGNKRAGAYAFIWFLHEAKILDQSQITPSMLTPITLLIAESNVSFR